MHLVRTTYANDDLINSDNESWQRYQFLANNCAKLAAFLESVPEHMHDQESFVEPSELSKEDATTVQEPSAVFAHCGTTACAMGWAALSHIVPGLQYVITDYNAAYPNAETVLLSYNPTINGRETNWDDAAVAFFGENAHDSIFYQYGDKAHTIQLLYQESERLCKIARGLKNKNPEVLDLII